MIEVIGITVSKEMGTWTVRVNGVFIADFWREAKARRYAMNLHRALTRGMSV